MNYIISFFKTFFRNFKYLLLTIYYSRIQHKDKINIYNWNKIFYNRIAVLNLILIFKNKRNLSYLEIGCNTNDTFNSIPILDKTGVDPVQGGNIKKTSDEFFKSNSKFFDLVFIDGLHTYQQIKKDVINSLNFLNDDGYILVHDMLPLNWKQQHIPQLSNDWTGDGWKIIQDLKNSSGLEFKIITVNFGILIIKKIDKAFKIPNSLEYENLNFKTYYDNFHSLPLISFEEFESFLFSNKLFSK